MERFFGMEIKGDGIVIRPLESVTQFYKEGKAMHHCVYANRYYRRSECLIMTAIVGEKHVETIEVNLKSFQIVQSRAVCNGTSEYHDRIIQLVEKNMNLIKNLLHEHLSHRTQIRLREIRSMWAHLPAQMPEVQRQTG